MTASNVHTTLLLVGFVVFVQLLC